MVNKDYFLGKPSLDPEDPDYVPNQHMGYSSLHTLTAKDCKKRYERLRKRQRQIRETEASKENMEPDSDLPEIDLENISTIDTSSSSSNITFGKYYIPFITKTNEHT